jgi:hypothetical protein
LERWVWVCLEKGLSPASVLRTAPQLTHQQSAEVVVFAHGAAPRPLVLSARPVVGLKEEK